MNINETQKKIARYFSEKLEAHGATAKGVDYNSPEAQEIRFEQLVKVIDPSHSFSVIDYGSGYGALFEFLQKKGWTFEYHGFDLVEEMVSTGKDLHKDYSNAHFTTSEKDLKKADYLIAGAIFNIKLDAPYEEWKEMVQETLQRMNNLCQKGFSFNMLTIYSDADRMAERPDLFYADPLFFFDFCKRNISRNVALLHDYGIYDFTLIIRKEV